MSARAKRSRYDSSLSLPNVQPAALHDPHFRCTCTSRNVRAVLAAVTLASHHARSRVRPSPTPAVTVAAADPYARHTPMMQQYLRTKAEHPGVLLFYRMGDFYEMFFADAEAAATALDIALTKRGQHLGQDIAMCGVPAVGAEPYLEKLIRKGFKVAVCEQTEDPAAAKKRGAKSVVARDVVRLVTPGTLTEDALLDARRRNYLACLARTGGDLALAYADLTDDRDRLAEVVSSLRQLHPADLIADWLGMAQSGQFEPLAAGQGHRVSAVGGKYQAFPA